MKTKNILIIGATSGMAEALARRYAAENARFALVARQQDKLEVIAADLAARGAAGANFELWDANDVTALPGVIDRAWQSLGRVDMALIAHGTLPDQQRAEHDMAYAVEHFRLNGESAVACMLGLASRFEAQGDGVMAVIGSVAGDRGRGSNYLYGSAKAAVHACASGLRARLFKKGVHVLTIKPGFVATPMTVGLNLPAKLTVTPERVADDIYKAIEGRKDVIYTPWFWAFIMLIIRVIPVKIFKRTGL